MSVWVAEEAMRCALRFCSRKFLWQSRFPVKPAATQNSSSLCKRLTHTWDIGRSHSCLAIGLASSVQFYSQGRIHNDEVKEKDLSSAPAESSLSSSTISGQTPRQSPFVAELQKCCSPSDVLDLTCKYAPTIKQISSCLNHMWSTSKKMSDEQLRYERQLMFEHPAFETLLQKAMKSAWLMDNDCLVHSLLSMVNLGVPQQSRVVQTLLQTCQEKMNNFDEKSLSILATCLEKMNDSPSVGALKHGMRLIVEARLPGIQSVLALQTMMRLLGKDVPLDLKKKLERKALSMTGQFSLPNTQYMISTMATMGFYSRPLLEVCSKTITENLHGTPFNILYKVLQSCKELHYRDLNMLTGVSNYIASTLDIWTNKQLLFLLSMFEKFLFCPTALMDAFAEKVVSDPNVLTFKHLLCVLRVYSSLNYDLHHRRETFLDSVSQVLDSYLHKLSAFELLKSVYFLCLLGHFPSAPLEKLLQSSTVEQINSSASKSRNNQQRMLRTVDLCLHLDLCQPLTVPSLGNTESSIPSVNPQLSQGLQTVLGEQADTMLQEMVMVEDFYLIDAVITKPVPNQSDASRCAEKELSPAESSQRIAIVCAPPSGFCYGTSKPRGPLAVKIRHLKILGYTPVLITEQDLRSEEHRTKFLRGLIFPEQHRSNTEGRDPTHELGS
ncbi:FAST kinase domain-containing protein 2, mitochondrial [Betta splendens]|uniref:FAST kinase domain-containing protein 2, mitochondrial n=1 Tax=Betta splendens TaxID=158456 RepID=A0A6P7PMU5_BETSP|nr:FAST kinase domain-containing protein 2, mitochondrial [Betta splendens]